MGPLDPLRDARAGHSVRSFGHRGALPALAMLMGGWLTLRRCARTACTSWRFAADYLYMAGSAERAAMFGGAEGAQ